MNRGQARVVDPALSKVALGYKNQTYVGLSLMPIVSCPKSGIQLIKFGKEAFVRYNMRRAPGADVAVVQFGYAADPIALVQDSLTGKVPREWLRDGQDLPAINHEKQAVNLVMNSLHLGLELDIAELSTTASNYGDNNKIVLSGSDKWIDPNSNLTKQMNEYKEAIRSQAGVYPNRMVLTPGDFKACKDHPDVKEAFKYTTSKSITAEMLAAFFELEKVEVGTQLWTPDAQSDLQDCWKHTVLAYVPPESERSMATPAFGYTYMLENHPLVEESYFEKGNKSWMYPVEMERRPYMTGMEAGFLIQNAS